MNLTPKKSQQFEWVVLTNAQAVFDYEMIKKYSRIIIDTRGKFKLSKKIIKG